MSPAAPAPRRATLADHDAVVQLLGDADELHARLVPRYFKRPRRPARTRGELARMLTALDEAVYVIDSPPGEIAGLVHAQIYDTPPQPSLVPRRRCHIDSLFVAAAARRLGLGRRLVESASAWAREKGAEEILLTVWAGNSEGEAFYEALGFGRVSSVLARPL